MSVEPRRCALVIPGLLDLSSTECKAALSAAGRLPELELLFSRAQQFSFGRAGLEGTLFSLFDVSVESHLDLPVAAVSHRSDTGGVAAGWCLRADPVHLTPDRDQLVLLGPEALSLTSEETRRITAELNRFFADDGWRIEAPDPARWYLYLPQIPQLRTYALAQVRDQAIGNFLPAGADGKQWHRVMNEVQMLLHTCSVNLERQAARKLTVSSLWFWGGGVLPEVAAGQWSQVWTDEAISSGLAHLSMAEHNSLPQDAQTWLGQTGESGKHLIVLDELQQQWHQHSETAWQQALQEMQQQWIAPLLVALSQKQISKLEIYTCDGRLFSLTRRPLKHWWRRRKALPYYCQ